MSYIGSKPADKALTSDDITDGVISTAKIQDNAVTTAKTSYSDAPFRNIIINGDMSIAQRGTSTASITSAGYYTIDRFNFNVSSLGTWTQSQETDVPSGQGFSKSLKLDCTTADASPASSDRLDFQQRFEGQNLQYLKKGTSSAESLTLSFWVKSNKTGTYIVELFDTDNVRQISQAYTINSSNTWEKKTLTFAGDTSGALANDNGNSLQVSWWLGGGSDYTSGTLNTSWNSNTNANRAVGQVNLADSTANEWYITGVQLEVGSAASDFEFLPVDIQTVRCERYYRKFGIGMSGMNDSATKVWLFNEFQPVMRAAPTLGLLDTTPGVIQGTSAKNASSSTLEQANSTDDGLRCRITGFSGLTTGQAVFIYTENTLEMDAEL